MIETLTPASTHLLTTLAAARAALTVTQTDAALADLIAQASGIIQDALRRPEGLGRATYRQTIRLTQPAEYLVLAGDLAPAVSAVVADGITLPGTDYELSSGVLYRLSDDARVMWTQAKVVVTYQSGYTLLGDLPYAIERACIDMVQALAYSRGRDPGVRSESVEGVGAVSYYDAANGGGGIPKVVMDRIAPWARLVVA